MSFERVDFDEIDEDDFQGGYEFNTLQNLRSQSFLNKK